MIIKKGFVKIFLAVTVLIFLVAIILLRITAASSHPQMQHCEGGSVDPVNTTRCLAKGVTSVKCSPPAHVQLEERYFRCLEEKYANNWKVATDYMECKRPNGEVYGSSIVWGCNLGDSATLCPKTHGLQDGVCKAQIYCEGSFVDEKDPMRCPAEGVTSVQCPRGDPPWFPHLEGDFFRCLDLAEFNLKMQSEDFMECKTEAGVPYTSSLTQGCSNRDLATRCGWPYKLEDGKCVSTRKCSEDLFLHFEKGVFQCLNEKEFRSILAGEDSMQCKIPEGESYSSSLAEGCNAGDLATRCGWPYELEDGKCVSTVKCPKEDFSFLHSEGGVFQCLNEKAFRSKLKERNMMQCETSNGERYSTLVSEGCHAGDTAMLCSAQHELKDNRCVLLPELSIQVQTIVPEIRYVIVERPPPSFDPGQCPTYQTNFEKELKTNHALISAAGSVRRETVFGNETFKKSFVKNMSEAARAEKKAKTALKKFECTPPSFEATKEVVTALKREMEDVENDIELVSESVTVQSKTVGLQEDIRLAEDLLHKCLKQAQNEVSKKVCFDFDHELAIMKGNLKELFEAKDEVIESELIFSEEETGDLMKRLNAVVDGEEKKSPQSLQKKKSEKSTERAEKKVKLKKSKAKKAKNKKK